MPGISRVGQDAAGGAIIGGGQAFFRLEGSLVVVLGDAIASHGASPHTAPVMAQGSSFVRINGIPVCRAGHTATCGHAASGSSVAKLSD